MARKLTVGKAALVAFTFLVMAFAAFLPQFAFADSSADEVVLKDATPPVVDNATSAKAGKLKVELRGISDADGYDFQIALNKSFTKGLKETTKSSTNTSFSSLKPGKTYYVRARAYLNYEGVRYCTQWSKKVKTKIAIKPTKSKFIGKWKLVKSSLSSQQSTINYNKKYNPKKHFKIEFTKKGTATQRDYDGTKYPTLKWAATSKTAGYLLDSGFKYGSIKISKNKLVIKDGEKTWTLARL